MRVLITRPRQDGAETARLLSELDIETVNAPVMEISDIAGAAQYLERDLEGVQAILVTSANGVRSFARATARRDLPVFAVGDASAAVASQSGFLHVTSAAGDVATLADLVRDRLTPEDGALFHATGNIIAGDLAGDLTSGGFTVRRGRLYRTRMVDMLPEAARHALNGGTIDAALFYSPRTAAHFAKLVAAAELESACRNMIAGCLSAAVAQALAALPFAEIRIAEKPEQTALIATLTSKD
ncbi:MAG: uroporphyrinogen-III synthase [Alphaproteobacteria bacterium]|nr:uroporphyrinogen-III synthase [Alphaproteobacteria bacterium]